MISEANLKKLLKEIQIAEFELLIDFFNNQKDLAEILGMNRNKLLRLKRGVPPEQDEGQKVADLVHLVHLLLSEYNSDSAIKWLWRKNNHLENVRPIDLIRKNKFPQVVAAARQDIAGSYA